MFLQINNLEKFYGEKDNRVQVLKGLSTGIGKGEICVLLGPSGSGKSTLLNIIGGIESYDKGEIIINGAAMSAMNEKQMTLYRREHLGYLGSNPLDVDDLLHTLGLWEHKDKIPSQLSGGQQQRTSIGRAIVKNPDLLLCDEPTGALDYNTSKDILKLIEDVNRKYGNTIIIVTHNDAIKLMADRVIKLRDGMIRKEYTNETKTPAMELDW